NRLDVARLFRVVAQRLRSLLTAVFSPVSKSTNVSSGHRRFFSSSRVTTWPGFRPAPPAPAGTSLAAGSGPPVCAIPRHEDRGRRDRFERRETGGPIARAHLLLQFED